MDTRHYLLVIVGVWCCGIVCVHSIPNLDYKKLRDAPFSKRYLDDPITKQLLGGIDIMPYTGKGGGEDVKDAKDLNCDFSGQCCWNNVDAPTDQLDWGLASTDPDPTKAGNLIKGDPPRAPYLITASTTTSSLTYGDLFSCSIQCQTGPGTLTFKHWSSPGIKFDVCIAQTGQTQFGNCQTVDTSSNDASVQIPQSTTPFQIAIVTSEFTTAPGGVAMIKDITYDAPVCGSSPGTTAAPAVCQLCNFEQGDLCKLSNGAGGSSQWQTRDGVTANWAAGVLPLPKGSGSKYAGAQLDPKQQAILQTPQLNLAEDGVLHFKYYECAHGVTLKTCIDSPDNCPFSTPLDVSPGDRQWKDGTMPISKGQHTIYIIGDNQDGEYAGVGVDDLTLTKSSGDPISC